MIPDQRKYFRNLLLHFRPSEVPERTLRLSLTWGLGGMAMVLVFLLVATGLLLKFAYQPSPALAYDSILYLETQIPFGQLLRNLHRWSGNALIFISFLHLLRVFYTGAFAAPRQVNWIYRTGAVRGRRFIQFHRLPAALGSDLLLGNHDQHFHAGLRSAGPGR